MFRAHALGLIWLGLTGSTVVTEMNAYLSVTIEALHGSEINTESICNERNKMQTECDTERTSTPSNVSFTYTHTIVSQTIAQCMTLHYIPD